MNQYGATMNQYGAYASSGPRTNFAKLFNVDVAKVSAGVTKDINGRIEHIKQLAEKRKLKAKTAKPKKTGKSATKHGDKLAKELEKKALGGRKVAAIGKGKGKKPSPPTPQAKAV